MPKNPLFKNGLTDGVFHLAKDTIPDYVNDYTMALEVEESKEWCKCEWIIHPDDVNISAGMCRKCGLARACRYELINGKRVAHRTRKVLLIYR